MTVQEIKESVRKNLKKLPSRAEQKGGQTTGYMHPGIRLYCEELDCEVMIGCHRSQLNNYDLAMTIMDILIDENIK
jgi:protein subunit release factor A